MAELFWGVFCPGKGEKSSCGEWLRWGGCEKSPGLSCGLTSTVQSCLGAGASSECTEGRRLCGFVSNSETTSRIFLALRVLDVLQNVQRLLGSGRDTARVLMLCHFLTFLLWGLYQPPAFQNSKWPWKNCTWKGPQPLRFSHKTFASRICSSLKTRVLLICVLGVNCEFLPEEWNDLMDVK